MVVIVCKELWKIFDLTFITHTLYGRGKRYGPCDVLVLTLRELCFV